MLVILITVLFPSVLINLLTFSIIKNQMQKDAASWLTGITMNSGKSMESYIGLVKGITKNPEYDVTLMNIFEQHRFNLNGIYGYSYEELSQINGWLSMMKEMDTNIVAVNFIDENGNRFHLGKKLLEENSDWIQKTNEAEGGSVIWPPVKIPDGDTVFAVSRTIINPRTFHSIATIQLYFQLNFLTDVDNETFKVDGNVIILNHDDSILFDLKGKTVGQFMDWNQQEQFYASFDSELTGWKLVGIIPKSVLFNKIDRLQKWILFINLIFILLTMAIVFLLSFRLTRPLWRLSRMMQNAPKTNFDVVPLRYKQNDEIGMISSSFNLMIRRMDDNYRISDMASLLGNLLRYSIGGEREWVEVRQECDYIRTYIRIMEYRFPLIRLDLQIDDNVKHWLMIRLIIQPIVENAIIHGIVPNGREGSIVIRLGEKKTEAGESRLFIHIEDYGVGMSEQTVVEIMQYLRGAENNEVPKGGIGLKNVYDRIALSYECDFEFTLQSEEGVGTIFYIEVPRRINYENHDRRG